MSRIDEIDARLLKQISDCQKGLSTPHELKASFREWITKKRSTQSTAKTNLSLTRISFDVSSLGFKQMSIAQRAKEIWQSDSLGQILRQSLTGLDSNWRSLPRSNIWSNAGTILSDDTFGDGRYQYFEPPVRSGEAEIWKAIDLRSSSESSTVDSEARTRVVALKRPSRADLESMNSANAEARLLSEAKRAAVLEHTNICPVYDIFEGSPTQPPFYTMRFLAGQTLHEVISKFHSQYPIENRSKQDWQKLAQMVIDIASGVAYAHTVGYVHLDLKPANVSIGDNGDAIVLDWGMASQLISSEKNNPVGYLNYGGSSATRLAGITSGTPAYAAPEQMLGQPCSIATDVFQLGAILFECLTGFTPFGDSSIEVAILKSALNARHMLTDETRFSHLQKYQLGDLSRICEKAMQTRPCDRYSSVLEFQRDLQAWLVDIPLSLGKESLSSRAARLFRKNRKSILSGLVVNLAIVVFSISVIWISRNSYKQMAERFEVQKELVEMISVNESIDNSQVSKARNGLSRLKLENPSISTDSFAYKLLEAKINDRGIRRFQEFDKIVGTTISIMAQTDEEDRVWVYFLRRDRERMMELVKRVVDAKDGKTLKEEVAAARVSSEQSVAISPSGNHWATFDSEKNKIAVGKFGMEAPYAWLDLVEIEQKLGQPIIHFASDGSAFTVARELSQDQGFVVASYKVDELEVTILGIAGVMGEFTTLPGGGLIAQTDLGLNNAYRELQFDKQLESTLSKVEYPAIGGLHFVHYVNQRDSFVTVAAFPGQGAIFRRTGEKVGGISTDKRVRRTILARSGNLLALLHYDGTASIVNVDPENAHFVGKQVGSIESEITISTLAFGNEENRLLVMTNDGDLVEMDITRFPNNPNRSLVSGYSLMCDSATFHRSPDNLWAILVNHDSLRRYIAPLQSETKQFPASRFGHTTSPDGTLIVHDTIQNKDNLAHVELVKKDDGAVKWTRLRSTDSQLFPTFDEARSTMIEFPLPTQFLGVEAPDPFSRVFLNSVSLKTGLANRLAQALPTSTTINWAIPGSSNVVWLLSSRPSELLRVNKGLIEKRLELLPNSNPLFFSISDDQSVAVVIEERDNDSYRYYCISLEDGRLLGMPAEVPAETIGSKFFELGFRSETHEFYLANVRGKVLIAGIVNSDGIEARNIALPIHFNAGCFEDASSIIVTGPENLNELRTGSTILRLTGKAGDYRIIDTIKSAERILSCDHFGGETTFLTAMTESIKRLDGNKLVETNYVPPPKTLAVPAECSIAAMDIDRNGRIMVGVSSQGSVLIQDLMNPVRQTYHPSTEAREYIDCLWMNKSEFVTIERIKSADSKTDSKGDATVTLRTQRWIVTEDPNGIAFEEKDGFEIPKVIAGLRTLFQSDRMHQLFSYDEESRCIWVLAQGEGNHSLLQCWSIDSKSISSQHEIPLRDTLVAVFSRFVRNGQLAAVLRNRSDRVQEHLFCWSNNSGKTTNRIQISESPTESTWITSIALSPNAKEVVVGNSSGSVEIVSLQGNRRIIEFDKNESEPVEKLEFDLSGNRLLLKRAAKLSVIDTN